jgi:Fe-S cluster biogenesis protein NfuA
MVQVRPYLMADGGDVEVVEVKDGNIFLRLQVSTQANDVWL